MDRPKVVITERTPLLDESLPILERYAKVEVCPSPASEVIKEKIADADLLMVVYAKVTSEVLEAAPKLKGIVRYGTGVDNVDVDKATERGVVVANVPDYATESVADYTIALLLALVRKIVAADKLMRKRRWGAWYPPPEEIRGLELRGKTLGLIGFGKIGKAVTVRAVSFGMRVVTYDPYLPIDAAEAAGVELAGLDELLRRSDFISLHAPLTKETENLLNEGAFSKMKKGVFIVNTARGGLIDHHALIKALKEGRVAGAALDVFCKEPPDPEDPIFEFDNVILTQHIAWYTEEALRRLERTAVQQAIGLLSGKIPAYVVNPGVFDRLRKPK